MNDDERYGPVRAKEAHELVWAVDRLTDAVERLVPEERKTDKFVCSMLNASEWARSFSGDLRSILSESPESVDIVEARLTAEKLNEYLARMHDLLCQWAGVAVHVGPPAGFLKAESNDKP